MRDNSGKPLRLTGVNIDITERKETDRALRMKEAELEVILDRTPFMLARVSRDLRYRYVSAAYARMARRTPEELAGRPMVEVLGEEGLASIRPYIEAVLRGETVEYEREVNFVAVGPRRLQAMYVPDRDGRGEIIGWIANIIDVTEGRQAEALRAANALLVEADRQKNDFLGMLSHELRNPLAPIRSSSYILRHAQPGSEQVRRAREVIDRQTEHLTRLVDDLLDVTRVARGKVELRRAHIDLGGVVSHAADDFRALLQDRGVRFEVVVPKEKLWVDADATRITQIIGNLLNNAAKFTRRGDEVALLLGAVGGEVEIRVRDTGAGIEPSLLPNIFDAFVQGDRTLARTEGGLGLGLSLVKGIAELHGGSVRAESAGKGVGAEFVIRLPRLAAPNAQSPKAPPAQRRNGARRVLVVDDNEDAAESLAEVVKMLGHTVEVAYDGPSAIEKVRTSQPDIVLCDIGLPGMSGYEVARRLRASHVNGIRLIAVSGYAGHEDVSRAVDAGFDEHVAKPCGPEQIERLLS
jgi:PAS domain S-box-containing protein